MGEARPDSGIDLPVILPGPRIGGWRRKTPLEEKLAFAIVCHPFIRCAKQSVDTLHK
jgi:hypothetical protein